MKKYICLLIFGVLTAQVTAQTQHNSYHSIIKSAYEESISDEFLFLIDDDIQKITFNPARALNKDRSFVNGNFEYGSDMEISSSGLFRLKSGKWFYGIGINSRMNSISFEGIESFEFSRYIYENEIREYMSTEAEDGFMDTRSSNAEFKLLKIFGSEENSYAFGVFGAYFKNNEINDSQTLAIRSSLTESYSGTTLIQDRLIVRTNTTDRLYKNIQEQFVFGLELYRWKNNSDSRHKVYFQKNMFKNNEIAENLFEIVSDDLLDTEDLQRSERISQSNYTNESNPIQFRYNGYKNFQLNWLGSDFIFVSAKGTYSSGHTDADFIELVRETNTVDGIIEYESANQADWRDVHDWYYSGGVSAGYAIKFSDDDISFFSGVQSSYQLSKSKYFNLERNQKRVLKDRNHSIGFILPAVTSVSLTENFKIWGGANIKGEFRLEKSNRSMFLALDDAFLTSISPIEFEIDQKSFLLSQQLFAGITFSHRSGLSGVINFRSNISNLHGWVMSLRYSY